MPDAPPISTFIAVALVPVEFISEEGIYLICHAL